MVLALKIRLFVWIHFFAKQIVPEIYLNILLKGTKFNFQAEHVADW